jgi:hypothetical protein
VAPAPGTLKKEKGPKKIGERKKRGEKQGSKAKDFTIEIART